MVDHPALGVGAADPRARVHTVQVLTGQDGRTVGVDGAFWPTCDIGVTEILRDTLTCASPGSSRADGILPTGRGVAWVYNFSRCRGCNQTNTNQNTILLNYSQSLTCGNPRTANEGVPGVPWVTPAVCDVVVDMTRGVVATHTRTWVNTVLVDTGQVTRTLSIDNTLGLTLDIGVTRVVSDTRAASSVTELIAHCINTTRRWVTWLYNNW